MLLSHYGKSTLGMKLLRTIIPLLLAERSFFLFFLNTKDNEIVNRTIFYRMTIKLLSYHWTGVAISYRCHMYFWTENISHLFLPKIHLKDVPLNKGHICPRAPIGPRLVNWPIASSMYSRGTPHTMSIRK